MFLSFAFKNKEEECMSRADIIRYEWSSWYDAVSHRSVFVGESLFFMPFKAPTWC